MEDDERAEIGEAGHGSPLAPFQTMLQVRHLHFFARFEICMNHLHQEPVFHLLHI